MTREIPMRDYAAELAEYARVAAPIAGWHPLHDDGNCDEINVALCESHAMDWLAEQDEWLMYWSQTSASVGIQEQHYPTRLLALIAKVAATKGETA